MLIIFSFVEKIISAVYLCQSAVIKKDGKMKIYLIIPNGLLLSSGLNGQKTPDKKAKIIIGLGVPNLMHISSVTPPGEIIETKSSINHSKTMVCSVGLSKGYLSMDYSGKSEIGVEGMKTIKLIKPIVSQQCLALCDQI